VIDEASATANTSNSNQDSCQSKFITQWKRLSENFGAKRAKAHPRTSQPAAEEIVKKEAAKDRYLAAKRAAAKHAPPAKRRA
jgi:hypothetical protein